MPVIPNYPLPADLPTDWQPDQIIAPNGADVELSEQHGYNYLNGAVNQVQTAINDLVDMANSATATGAVLTAGSLVITIPGEAQHGMSIKFEAPCDSADITVGVTINGTLYQWMDTLGEGIAGFEALFAESCMVGIIIDRENLIAYLATAAPAKGFVEYETGSPPANMIPGTLYGEVMVDYSASG